MYKAGCLKRGFLKSQNFGYDCISAHNPHFLFQINLEICLIVLCVNIWKQNHSAKLIVVLTKIVLNW